MSEENKEGKKRILLVNPPLICSKKLFDYPIFIPYTLLKIGAYLKSKGHDVKMLDFFKHAPVKVSRPGNNLGYDKEVYDGIFLFGSTFSEVKHALSMEQPSDEIWISTTLTYSWKSYHKTVEVCKEVFPDSKVRMGGTYATLCPEKARESKADEVFVGEIEEADMFFPDYSLLENPGSCLLVNATKGCINKCSYCATHILEKKRIIFEPEKIVDYIEENARKYGFKTISFVDSNILMNGTAHLEKIIDLILERKINVSMPQMNQGFQSNLVTPKLMDKLAAIGMKQIFLPLESISEADRKRFHRPESVRQILEVIMLAKERNMGVVMKILMGMPEQPIESVLRSLCFTYENGCIPNLAPFTPIPKTEEYRKYMERIKGKDLHDLDPELWPFANNDAPMEDLEFIFNKFKFKLYSIPEIMSMEESHWSIKRMKEILKENLGPKLKGIIENGKETKNRSETEYYKPMKMPKFSIGYNQNLGMLKILEENKEHIEYFYFPIPSSFAGSGRRELHKKKYLGEIKTIIKRCNELKIKPLMLLNSTCDGKLIGNKEYMGEVVQYIKKLYSIGLKAVTVTNLLYVPLLKKEMPTLEIHSSVNCYVKNAEQALYLKEMGVDAITIDRDINYDLEEIKAIKKATGLKTVILVNEGCLQNCPFRQTHFNAIAHLAPDDSLFSTKTCSLLLKNNPHHVFRMQIIRPEDLRFYKNSIEVFKISTRKTLTEKIEKILKAYIDQKYDGNLLDLVDNKHKSIIKYICNPKLTAFDMIKKMQNCGFSCETCDFCKKVYEDARTPLK